MHALGEKGGLFHTAVRTSSTGEKRTAGSSDLVRLGLFLNGTLGELQLRRKALVHALG